MSSCVGVKCAAVTRSSERLVLYKVLLHDLLWLYLCKAASSVSELLALAKCNEGFWSGFEIPTFWAVKLFFQKRLGVRNIFVRLCAHLGSQALYALQVLFNSKILQYVVETQLYAPLLFFFCNWACDFAKVRLTLLAAQSGFEGKWLFLLFPLQHCYGVAKLFSFQAQAHETAGTLLRCTREQSDCVYRTWNFFFFVWMNCLFNASVV